MVKQEFQAESKRLLDLMINSIYTHKEIFLRELISNASDAIDKYYYMALTEEHTNINKEDFDIKIHIDKESRLLTISDTGIGMTEEELNEHLGIIAKSGSLAFKKDKEPVENLDIIGQFGVGFYSAFMVARTVTVISKSYSSEHGYKWESSGADGYTIERTEKDKVGTDIILTIKENTDDENFDEFLEEYRIKEIIRRYSNFIRYPIKMEVSKTKLQEDSSQEYVDFQEEEIINSMVPIWRRNRNELSEDDYENFYQEKGYGFDKPLKSIHLSMDGLISYNAIFYIPSKAPFDFYSQEHEKGLELYSSGVLIMEKCSDLLPDYFSFVRGVVDSEDLSLNISREILQHDRQLSLIAKRIEEKIKDELATLLKEERKKYESFFDNFGKQIKYGLYRDFGVNKNSLQDLVMFYSSREKGMVTLEEYVNGMKENQKYIYYATGDSVARIDRSPQTELLKDKDYEILYLVDDIDEFAIKVLNEYSGIEFKSSSSGNLGIEEDEKLKEIESETKENKDLFDAMGELLGNKIKKVRPSSWLKSHPVCLSSEGEVSIEMEKILKTMPNNESIEADKILEINIYHDIFEKLQEAFTHDKEKFELYTRLLYDQALLMEGLSIDDPVAFSNNICKLM